jgi:hypothetical protein
MFEIGVAVTIKSVFYLEIIKIIFFYFKKLILKSKQSENIKILIFNKKN